MAWRTFKLQLHNNYRSGKKNANTDNLSKLHENVVITTVFPDVLKAICQLVMVEKNDEPFANSLVAPDTVPTIDQTKADVVPGDFLSATVLANQDWQTAQAADANINFLIDIVLEGSSPTLKPAKCQNIDTKYLPD